VKSFELDDTLSPEAHSDHLLTLPILRELGSTMVEHPRSTIEPRHDPSTTGDARAKEGVPRTAKGADALPGFVVRETLGEGGMGVVRVAEQSALGRQVAIKTLKGDLGKNQDAAMRLLREAWLTGRLEHPNVVPIYDLGMDEAGRPHIVMRKVEGKSWDAFLADPSLVKDTHGASDVLEWHLRVFVQVTQAVSLAHAKRIVHRDIKPENVMVGEFGEVYLLDWGIAVSLQDDGTGRLPLAKDATEAAGTPCYMAPEMLGLPSPKIDERTDIYLLGSTLYDIVAGKPPHEGKSFVEMVKSIVYSSPSFPEDSPRELAAICTRAMARLQEDRYASVGDLRSAVLDYLTHRGSSELAAEATTKRAELFSKLSTDEVVERQEIYNVFGAVRFGYLEALRTWPENLEAEDGLRGLLLRMIDYELGRGSAEAAHAILAELSTPEASLVERVDTAMRARAEEKRRIEKLDALEAEFDPNVGRRTRLFVGGILGAIGVLGPVLLAVFEQGEPSLPGLAVRSFLQTGLVIGLLFWARDSLGKSRLNRSVSSAIVVGFLMQLLVIPGALLMNIPLHHHVTLTLLLWSILAAAIAVTSEIWFAVPAVMYLLGFYVAARFPAARFWVQSAGNLSNLLVVLMAWSTKEDLKRLGAQAKAFHRRA
jgi:eukaryotic-like serine/threonine-protein kinase